ncbi:hypothetical protein GCM10027294_43390 [Marinactinospora endophytica]
MQQPQAERRGAKWRVRVRDENRNWIPLGSGFDTEEEALAHGWEQVAKMGRGQWIDPRKGEIALTEWANAWLPSQELTLGARQQYRYLLSSFILPAFGHRTLNSLTYADHEINAWENKIRAAYAPSTARQARGRLDNMLEDAVVQQLMTRNPARRRAGRGSIEQRRLQERPRHAEGRWTTPLGALLIAERASILSGRDDEFIMIITAAYTGIRFGELLGIQRDSLHMNRLHVRWQLYELSDGSTIRKLPKDGSRRVVDVPAHVARLLRRQMRTLPPMPEDAATCPCVKLEDPDYRREYGHPAGIHIFRGPAASGPRAGQVRYADAAALAGVSVGTVANVLNRPDRVSAATRVRVQRAIEELGGALEGSSATVAPHWRRESFRSSIFHPAATGLLPAKGGKPARPVSLAADGWTGRPLRGGRNVAERSRMSWRPVAQGLTPHSLRHSHKTWMLEDKIDRVLQDERLGHVDQSVQGAYSHPTPAMRDELMRALGERWEAALRDRARMWPCSHVGVLDDLLEPYRHLHRRYVRIPLLGNQLGTQLVPSSMRKPRNLGEAAGL